LVIKCRHASINEHKNVEDFCFHEAARMPGVIQVDNLRSYEEPSTFVRPFPARSLLLNHEVPHILSHNDTGLQQLIRPQLVASKHGAEGYMDRLNMTMFV